MYKFSKAQYIKGETVTVYGAGLDSKPEIHIYKLEEEVKADFSVSNGTGETVIAICGLATGNYGVKICDGDNRWEGSFDIVSSARAITRYGFLADFSNGDDDTDDVEWMKDMHINAVQFYDWMFRHDCLLPDSDEYEDPLGRKLCLSVIRKKTIACKKYGMRPFAYGAIYAATKEFFEKHRDWGMYTLEHEPMTFANWLNFMNVSHDCGWTEHLLKEYCVAVDFGFEGIHMDTYGFPKKVRNYQGKAVDLANEFTGLIDSASAAVRGVDPEAGVIFNAVNDWPVEKIAKSSQDSVYIEVWPPHDTYYDLFELITKARSLSGKNVVLAAYLKPFDNASACEAIWTWQLTWAAICAGRGTQLVLGENRSLLKDSYYVNYAKLDDESCNKVASYCDFLVRYADLLYADCGIDISKTASGGINEDICFFSEKCSFSTNAEGDSVWTIIRESEKMITVNMINLTGNDNQWNVLKNEPDDISEIVMSFRLDRKITGIYTASPDDESLQAVSLRYSSLSTPDGRVYRSEPVDLKCWRTVWIKMED